MPGKRLLAAIVLLALPFITHAQMTNASRVYGENDQDIPTPQHSTKAASDASAVQALVNFLQATGLTGWSGMTASGTMVIAGQTASYSAKLSILGGTQYRLDVVRDAGTESTIFNGPSGLFLAADGQRSSVSSDIATTGLVAFPRVLAAGYPTPASIVTDKGSVTISGVAEHRITLDDPSTDSSGNPWKTIDLYFDPSTNYLLESVAPVHLSTADAAIYMLETTYSNYQSVGSGNAVLPFTISQFLNGQLQWTLTLTQASTSTLPAASIFNF
jgi:hypothetical protein